MTDAVCHYIHLLDMVESQGGSAFLIRILNRLGICSSSDVLSRFMQYTVDSAQKTECLQADSFTLVSADNIDFLHSYARTFRGSHNSSWHGTTVQAVQPLPSISMIMQSASNMSIHDSVIETHVTPMEISVDTVTTHYATNLNGANEKHPRKRTQRPSPVPSPLKLTRSPLPKIQRRMRTGTENSDTTKDTPSHLSIQMMCDHMIQQQPACIKKKTLADFYVSFDELQALSDLQKDTNTYMLYQTTLYKNSTDKIFINIQNFFSVIRPTHTETSKVMYVDVMDAVADSKDTITQLLQCLYEEYIIEKGQQMLVVAGDAKVYELILSLKFEYGEALKWVIPYPGDWHLLKNYQLPLMKAYYDSGLKALAKTCGYPLASIQSCGQFKRTHQFILEVWEAMYRAMLETFLDSRDINTSRCQNTSTY